MSAGDDLKNEFQTRYPQLTTIAKKYLGWADEYTIRKASSGDVPFNIFKVVDSNKSPWLVDVYDFGDYLEKRRGMRHG